MANDPFISTTTDIDVAREFNQSGSNLGIAKIDLNKVPSQALKGYEIYSRVNGVEGLPYHYSVWQKGGFCVSKYTNRSNRGVCKMIKDRILEIEEIINTLTVDLIVPIRTSKTINKEVFDKLYFLLDELKILIKGKEMINRKLAGLLFFIYTTISSEAEHTHYLNPIFIEASRLEDYLNKILWDSPFGQGI